MSDWARPVVVGQGLMGQLGLVGVVGYCSLDYLERRDSVEFCR